MENKYGLISSLIYDKTKPPGTSIDNDLTFYKEMLLPVEGKILEAGVGNGRLLIPLLKYKLNIEGIDKSKEMLEICKDNLTKEGLQANLILNDLKDFKPLQQYEIIFAPNATLNLIENLNDLKVILNNFYNGLINKGKLIVDLILPVDFKVGSNHNFIHNIDNINYKVKNYSQEINWIEQYTINKIQYFKDDQLLETQDFKISWYGINEFNMLLEKSGFKDLQILINYGQKRVLNIKTVTFICFK